MTAASPSTSCTVCETLPPSSAGSPLRLHVKDLHVGYGNTAILPPISFELKAGEIWALFGPNGGGKSTLLRTLHGLQPPISGTIDRCGSDISAVSQRQQLDPLLPARGLDVILEGTQRGFSFVRPWLSHAAKDAAKKAIADTDSATLLHQPFHELSEGQKQRVLIARALASSPALLTLDEPTSAMDPFHEEAVFRLLEKITAARELGVLVASHHMHILTECAANAIYVDREYGVAISGRFQDVATHPVVLARYGDLMTARPCHSLQELRRLDDTLTPIEGR